MADIYDPNAPQDETQQATSQRRPPQMPAWWNQQQVNQWYVDELGRPAVNPDTTYAGQETGGNYGMEHAGAGSLADVYGTIHNSPEAAAYRESKNKPPPTTAAPEPQSPYSGGGGSGQLDDLISQLMNQFSQSNSWLAEDRAQRKQWADYLKGQLTSQMQKASEPVDPSTDPLMKRQLQAADFNNQRTLQQSRETMAARSAAEGGPTTGAQDAAVQSGTENLGIALNDRMLKMWADEVDKRRQILQDSITQGVGILGPEQAAETQQQIAQLSTLSTSLRAKMQNQQFYDEMGYTASHDNAILNYLYTQLAGAR